MWLNSRSAALGLAVLSFALVVWGAGWTRTAACWGLKRSDPTFVDARTITTAAESSRAGYDPMRENPHYSEGTLMNYPRIWQGLARTGLSEDDTTRLALGFAGLFFVGVLLLPVGGLCWPGLGLLVVAVFSPSGMLALERGNNDLCVFFLVASGARLLSLGKSGAIAGSILLFVAFVLKLFPVFSFAVITRWKGKAFGSAAGLLAFGTFGYLALSWQDLPWIAAGTPRATGASYGAKVLWMEIAQHSELLARAVRGASYAGMLLAVVLAVTGWHRSLTAGHGGFARSAELDAFRAGGAIYVGTFFLGNNWDYRLVFLLLTLPQLIRWAADKSPMRWVSRGVLAAVLLSLWHIAIHRLLSVVPGGSPAAVMLDEAANWVVFLGLAWLLGGSMGRWTGGVGRDAPVAFSSSVARR